MINLSKDGILVIALWNQRPTGSSSRGSPRNEKLWVCVGRHQSAHDRGINVSKECARGSLLNAPAVDARAPRQHKGLVSALSRCEACDPGAALVRAAPRCPSGSHNINKLVPPTPQVHVSTCPTALPVPRRTRRITRTWRTARPNVTSSASRSAITPRPQSRSRFLKRGALRGDEPQRSVCATATGRRTKGLGSLKQPAGPTEGDGGPPSTRTCTVRQRSGNVPSGNVAPCVAPRLLFDVRASPLEHEFSSV